MRVLASVLTRIISNSISSPDCLWQPQDVPVQVRACEALGGELALLCCSSNLVAVISNKPRHLPVGFCLQGRWNKDFGKRKTETTTFI